MFWRSREVQKISSLEQHVAVVENILLNTGRDPVRARMDIQQGYGWRIQQGSALIEIYIAQQEDREYLQVVSPIVHLPSGTLLPLYRRLLELNLTLTNASLGVYLDVIYVFNERPLAGLDAQEADFIIQQISDYADRLDNELVNEFGGRLFEQNQ